MAYAALDGALERFAVTGPEFGPGLSNHGPMATEALVALGRHETVEAWAEWYTPRLAERPSARNTIHDDAWREALGDIGRVADWSGFFQRQVDANPWQAVLETWAVRLAAGIMAGATHGVIRAAHAVRALDHGETPQRVAELGEALAYWAARYQELPAAALQPGRLSPAEALRDVPLVEQSQRRAGLIFDAVRAVDAETFAPVINLVDVSGDEGAFLSDLTRMSARLYLANAQHASIAMVHSVTAPAALRMLAPHLSDATRREALRYTWQACAALYSTYARGTLDAPGTSADASFDEQDLIEQAVAARDEHAIKFPEACLREYRLSPHPAYIAAAKDAVVRLRARD